MTARDTNAGFGQHRRDWTLLWRVVMLGVSLAGAGASALILYAGGSYVRAEATTIAEMAMRPIVDLPPRVRRLEEIAADRTVVLKESAAQAARLENALIRLTGLAENQQRQMELLQRNQERLQELIDRLSSRRE